MQVDLITKEDWWVAEEKWREYVAACKKFKDPMYKELKSLYYQMKKGKKLVDIKKAITKGGLKSGSRAPNLAITQATVKSVSCHYFGDGRVNYYNNEWYNQNSHTIKLGKETLPIIPNLESYRAYQMKAPVPMVPPRYIPEGGLKDDYYILWEVEEWKMVPPTDPWLLRKITDTIFIVLAAWDLTPLEKAVMAGRL